MKKKLLLQIFILAAGTAFAWYTVFGDFGRYFSAGGKLTQFSGCAYPNPLSLPCFYGAIAFLIALAWATGIYLNQEAEKRENSQKNLNWLLLAGTLFAWSNFSYQLYMFYAARTGEYTGCSGIKASSPFTTPCFYGASLYLLSFLISIFIIKTFNKQAA